jgi:hypothetical protein
MSFIDEYAQAQFPPCFADVVIATSDELMPL